MESDVIPGFFHLFGWAIFLGAAALSLVLGAILSFHWFRYAMNPNAAMVGTFVYGVGCIVILALLLGAVIGL